MPLVVWALVILTLTFIPLKIASYGLIPAGDARRHIAKGFTDKPYSEILVMRSEYKMDHSPGWELILRGLHRGLGWSKDALASFSMVMPLLGIFLVPLFWLRRPEAWLAALLAFFVANPMLMWRLTQGRPYLITEAVCMAVLLAWNGDMGGRRTLRYVATVAGVALSVWVHGAWYLWAIPVLAVVLTGQLRKAALLGGCVAVGVLAGGVLTGSPYVFLKQAVDIARVISAENLPASQLVGEFQPGDGNFITLAVLAVVWSAHVQIRRVTNPALVGPIAGQIVLCWILGFYADRFRADWAVPAVLLWLALAIQDMFEVTLHAASWRRAQVTCFLALPLFLHLTNDLGGRYSYSQNEVFLDAKNAALKPWFPDKGGIFYTADLDFFFRTFYQNPDGEWRYVLGMEPALMLDDDRQTYRNIQRTNHALIAYQPWLDKLRPEDRLVIINQQQPVWPALQWKHVGNNFWIGKRP